MRSDDRPEQGLLARQRCQIRCSRLVSNDGPRFPRIVPVREQYGFRCLFAVRDEPTDMFTWAFDFAGSWEEFPAAQRPYYHDPARVDLRGVFNFMADYSIHPARQLLL